MLVGYPTMVAIIAANGADSYGDGDSATSLAHGNAKPKDNVDKRPSLSLLL